MKTSLWTQDTAAVIKQEHKRQHWEQQIRFWLRDFSLSSPLAEEQFSFLELVWHFGGNYRAKEKLDRLVYVLCFWHSSWELTPGNGPRGLWPTAMYIRCHDMSVSLGLWIIQEDGSLSCQACGHTLTNDKQINNKIHSMTSPMIDNDNKSVNTDPKLFQVS